jgi:hypothetical protein
MLSFSLHLEKLIFSLCNQMENNQYHTVGTVLEFNRKTIERGKIYTSSTQPLTLVAWFSHFSKKAARLN